MAKERKITIRANVNKMESFNPHSLMGWNRWAFELAFYFLARYDISDSELFDYSQRETLRLGGDSDTNCCIVGGLIGAAVGLSNIDKEKVNKVLKQSQVKVKRPEFINPKVSNVEEMIE